MKTKNFTNKEVHNIMKNYFHLIFVIMSILVLFTSCDPWVSYSRIVQNNSDCDVKVFVVGTTYYADIIYTYAKDTVLIEGKTTKEICSYNGLGSGGSFANCDIPKDSISMLIYFNDSIKLISYINKLNNWSFRIIKDGFFYGGTDCECRLILTNELLFELK